MIVEDCKKWKYLQKMSTYRTCTGCAKNFIYYKTCISKNDEKFLIKVLLIAERPLQIFRDLLYNFLEQGIGDNLNFE